MDISKHLLQYQAAFSRIPPSFTQSYKSHGSRQPRVTDHTTLQRHLKDHPPGHPTGPSQPWGFAMNQRHTNFHSMDVSKNRVEKTQNGWFISWKTLLKWMIWGYHYFWKHPYLAKWNNISPTWIFPEIRGPISLPKSYLLGAQVV